ncbi:MAG: hypothetical protein ACRYG4_25575 [Janthinobacterium lividum]
MSSNQPEDGLIGLRPVKGHWPAGVMANESHQDPLGFMKARNFKLAVVEFDDQGRCYNRDQLGKVSDAIEHLRETRTDAIVLVFVHGWKHDARSDDDNLNSFRQVLDKTALHERRCVQEGKARDVYGIFVGWRGLTAYGVGGVVEDTTFWGRQEAGHRVATGSVRELFGRLRHWRNAVRKNGGSPLLVISGHSFGGMIVFSALAQSLIEAASEPVGHVIPGFADLVLLINPAIEGARYLPIHDLVSDEAYKSRADCQLPVFICIQARNDQPVGTFFPIGNAKNRLEESSIGDLEKRCVSHAIGFIDEFHTHDISGPAGSNPFVLTPPQIRWADPFWVIHASKEVIDGHGGIWQDPFLSFLAAVLFQHVNVSRAFVKKGSLAGSLEFDINDKSRTAPPATTGNLADFARTIEDPPKEGPPQDH